MSASLLAKWEEEIKNARGADRNELERSRREKIESYLDAGRGECLLRRPEVAEIVESALLHFDGVRYRMLAWVIMPNHVHTVFEMLSGHPLGNVVQNWKSFSAHAINSMLKRSGRIWYPDYWDRYIRDVAHLQNVIAYVHANPVKARLVPRAENWRWSSARLPARPVTKPTGPDGKF